MSKYSGLAGLRFGSWDVKEESQPVGGHSVYLCVCDCGSTAKVTGSNLAKGLSKSCGCGRLNGKPKTLVRLDGSTEKSNLSLRAAKDFGYIGYISDAPCKEGHKAVRDLNSRCSECLREGDSGSTHSKQKYLKAYPDRVIATKRACYYKNKDRWKESITPKQKENKTLYKANYYTVNAARIKLRSSQWYKNNKERAATASKIKYENNKTYLIQKASEERKNLADVYVKSLIADSSGLKHAEIPDSLVDAKRLHLQLTRKLKEKQK